MTRHVAKRKEESMNTNNGNTTLPPIVLIHGLWLTPRSWENWIARYESRGFQVIAPAYPGLEVEVEALRKDTSPIAKLTIDGVADHYEKIIRSLDVAPIIMGHSFGGTLTQLLLDRGLGCSAVVIDSAQVRGVRAVPISQIRSLLPALDNPAHRHQAVSLTPDQFHYAFTNVLGEDDSRAVYDRYHIAAPGKIIWDGALANFQPHSEARVDFKRDGRAPLLFIASSEDHLMPPAVNKANYELQKQNASVTAYVEFVGRCHYTCGQDGWEPVADLALSWAMRYSRRSAHMEVRDLRTAVSAD
jgi:pimeloyl-ACP methyl ester carboxylesterase